MATQVGIGFRKRPCWNTFGRQHGQVVDEEDAGMRGALAHLTTDRTQRMQHFGQGSVARITVQQFGYAPAQQR